MLTRLSLFEIVAVTGGSREAYKRMAICPRPSPQPAFSSPSLSSLFILYCGPGQLPLTVMARRPHGGVDIGRRTVVTTMRTVHFVASLLRPSPRLARCIPYTQASHLKAEGCLCLSRGVGGSSVAGLDTDAYFSTQISPSRLRPRRLIQHVNPRMNLADATTRCLHARV